MIGSSPNADTCRWVVLTICALALVSESNAAAVIAVTVLIGHLPLLTLAPTRRFDRVGGGTVAAAPMKPSGSIGGFCPVVQFWSLTGMSAHGPWQAPGPPART